MKFELTKLFLNDIIQKLDRQEYELVKSELSELHNVDIAELIKELDDEHGKILFELFEDEDLLAKNRIRTRIHTNITEIAISDKEIKHFVNIKVRIYSHFYQKQLCPVNRIC